MNPSPRPWKVGVFEILDANSVSLGGIELLDRIDGAADIDRANAAHIVHCVNLFDELVASLADVVGAIECGDYYNDVLLSQAKTVLEKARTRDET